MNLETLKAIAAARTKGIWHLAASSSGLDDESNIECGSCDIAIDVIDNEAEFIATAANTYDALLEIVELADAFADAWANNPDKLSYTRSKYLRARQSLEELE